MITIIHPHSLSAGKSVYIYIYIRICDFGILNKQMSQCLYFPRSSCAYGSIWCSLSRNAKAYSSPRGYMYVTCKIFQPILRCAEPNIVLSAFSLGGILVSSPGIESGILGFTFGCRSLRSQQHQSTPMAYPDGPKPELKWREFAVRG